MHPPTREPSSVSNAKAVVQFARLAGFVKVLRPWRGAGLRRRSYILSWCYVGHGGHVGYLAAHGFSDADSGMIQQQSRGSVQFDPRLLERRFRRDQIRLRSSQK